MKMNILDFSYDLSLFCKANTALRYVSKNIQINKIGQQCWVFFAQLFRLRIFLQSFDMNLIVIKLLEHHLRYAAHHINIQLQEFATLSRIQSLKFPFKFIIGNDNAMNYVDNAIKNVRHSPWHTKRTFSNFLSPFYVVKQSNEYRK